MELIVLLICLLSVHPSTFPFNRYSSFSSYAIILNFSLSNYLFHCPLYTTERGKMLDTVNEICSGNVDLNLLLHGGQTLDYCQNKTIIESVELYILETKRLL